MFLYCSKKLPELRLCLLLQTGHLPKERNHRILFHNVFKRQNGNIPNPNAQRWFPPKHISELKIRRRRDFTTADLVEGAWGEVAVAMAQKIALRKLVRWRVVVVPFPVQV